MGPRDGGDQGAPESSGQGNTPGSACVRGSQEDGAGTKDHANKLFHSLNKKLIEQTYI